MINLLFFADMITETETDEGEGDDSTVLTLTETEFNEYMAGGYFRGIKYRWTSRNGTYTVYISKSSYDKLKRNMETGSSGLLFDSYCTNNPIETNSCVLHSNI